MPYLWTVKEYKGDFLFRTSDVAIWTTVEIGIGITAACMATLKPLMRHMMTLAGVQSTDNVATGGGGGKSTRLRSNFGTVQYTSDQPLEELRLREDKGTTTTTIRGMNRSSAAYKNGWGRQGGGGGGGGGRRSDSEEEIMPSLPGGRGRDNRPEGWEGGISINRSVEVTATEESSDGEFAKAVDEGLGKPTWVYERV